MRTGPSLQRKTLASYPGSEQKTFAFVKIDLGSCFSFVLSNCLFHSFYVQEVGHKDGDVIGERGNPGCKKTNKRNNAKDRICPLIPKPSELGHQSEAIDKKR